MNADNCSCKNFEELRGASVSSYISAFLELSKDAPNRFVCKVCGTIWKKVKTEDTTKPVLVKIAEAEN